MPGRPFDPASYLRQVHVGGQTIEYLDVRWRLAWLRAEQPDAIITTEHIEITPEFAVFRATVQLVGGGAATGYGSARAGAGRAHVEEAESNALGRALLALGYGLAFAPDHVLIADDTPGASAQPATASPSSASGQRPAPAPSAGSAPAVAPAQSTSPSISPVAPVSPTAPPTLPAGVTVGTAGGRGLPPRLAAVFAQARPIVDEPVDEPAELAPIAPVVDAATGSVAEAVPSAPIDRSTPLTAGGAATPLTARRPDLGRRLAEAPLVADDADVGAGAQETAAGRPAARTGAPSAMPSVRRPEPAAGVAPPGLTGREPGRPSDRPRPATGRSVPPPTVFEDELTGGEAVDDPQADHDWSAFWPWARGKGYFNRDDIERAIGQSIRGRTPRELRTLLLNLDA